jgi:bifunctional UDP-N-acetylglucosamine pyrophosphorylase/glucosamine-1-phosphate N-acetyltransferase
VLTGKVIIEDGARILDFAIVEGPVYIGKNSVVGAHCILREGSILEEDTQIERFVDCTRSIIEMGTHIHSGFVGDSIIGDSVRVGAGFITGNKRIDRDLVEVKVKDKKVFTGSDRIGVLIGDNVKIGINVSTMPGVIIGNDSIIGPSTIVTKNVPGKTRIYVEQEIVQKSLIQ